MVNTLNPAPQGQPGFAFPPIEDPANLVNVGIMANATLETYVQSTSCMDCHGGGAPQGAPTPLTSSNQIFSFLLRNADSSDPSIEQRRLPKLGPLLRAAAAHR